MNEDAIIKAYDVNTFCKAYSVGRTLTYAEIKAGKLKATKIGRRTVISVSAAQEWFQSKN